MQGGWEGFGRHFDATPDLFHEPLERFYGERTGGFDRVLVAADYSIDRARLLVVALRIDRPVDLVHHVIDREFLAVVELHVVADLHFQGQVVDPLPALGQQRTELAVDVVEMDQPVINAARAEFLVNVLQAGDIVVELERRHPVRLQMLGVVTLAWLGGVAFDAQLLPEPVPHGPDDERLDWLLTDKRACAFV